MGTAAVRSSAAVFCFDISRHRLYNDSVSGKEAFFRMCPCGHSLLAAFVSFSGLLRFQGLFGVPPGYAGGLFFLFRLDICQTHLPLGSLSLISFCAKKMQGERKEHVATFEPDDI